MKLSYLQKYEKQNTQEPQSYCNRTKQYSNLGTPQNKYKGPNFDNSGSLYKRKVSPFGQNNECTPDYSPKSIDVKGRKQYLQKQRQSPLNSYEKTNRRQNYNDNYSKYLQKSSFDKREKQPKVTNHTQFEDSLDGQGKSDLSMVTPHRRQNARTKGIEIKMNNIDNINDKIGALLNMVHHSSKTPKKTQKQRDQYHNMEASPKRRLPQKDDTIYKNWDKSKRMKTYSGYDKSEDQLNYACPSFKFRNQNEEDRIVQYQRKTIKTRENDYDQYLGKEKSKNGYIYYQQEQALSPNTRQIRSKTGVRQKEQKYLAQDFCVGSKPSTRRPVNSNDTVFNFEESQRDYPSRACFGQYQPKNGKDMMPLSLQGLKNYSQLKSQGSYLIDQKLKKIQEKIAESESGKNRIQRRLDEKMMEYSNYRDEEAKTGQFYKRNELKGQQQPFELKVYQVKVERQNVVSVASRLLEQVELDIRLREAREEFLQNDAEDKWENLENQLKERGVQISINELREIISISAEQFSLLQENTGNVSGTLIDLLTEAQKHWEKRVCACTYLRILKSENFKESEIDTDRKGYISQENLVSFINRFTGRTLLLRDVSLIFRRLQFLQGMRRNDGIDFSTFLRVIAL